MHHPSHKIREIGSSGHPMMLDEYAWQVAERLVRRHRFTPDQANAAINEWSKKVRGSWATATPATRAAKDIAYYYDEEQVTETKKNSAHRANEPTGGGKFAKGDRVVTWYRSIFYSGAPSKQTSGTVVRQKKDGTVTVKVWDEEEGAEAYLDRNPQDLTRL